MLKKLKLNHNITMLLAAMTLVPTASHAQGLTLEEVVVTARKTEETLQDVPIAVTSYTGDQLDILGVQESGDLAFITPNFTWNTEFGRASPQPYLRGIGTNNFAPINTGPIAVYQDGVFIGPNIAQGFATFDVERAEVLKGPQGTLYGRNSTGGLINFISKKPTIGGGTNGFVNLEVGEFGTTNVEAAVGFDLGQTSAARVAILRNKNNGTFDSTNPDVPDQNITDDTAIRAAIVFEPSEKLRGLVNFHYGEADPDTAPFKSIGLLEPAPGGGTEPCLSPIGLGANCVALFATIPDEGDIFTTSKNEDSENVETTGGFLQLDYDISDSLSLTSLTSYDTAELNRIDDVGDTIEQFEFDTYRADFDFYSQELRLTGTRDRLNWQAGLYYYKETVDSSLSFLTPVLFNTGEGAIQEIDTESYAIFGNINYALSDKWNVSGGLRWSYEEKDVERYDTFEAFAPFDLNPQQFLSLSDPRILQNTIVSGTTGARDFDEITGRLSIDYTTESGNLWYASLSRGFKGGDVVGAGFVGRFSGEDTRPTDAQIAALGVQTQIVDPEILDAFEIGFKGDFGSNVRLNAALFYYDYQDQQQTVLQPDPSGLNPLGVTTLSNAASSTVTGFEADLTYVPTDRWYFQVSIGLLDATYDEFGNPLLGGTDFSGNDVPLTPDYEFSGLARYNLPLANGADLAFQVTVSSKGSTFFQPQNVSTPAEEFLQEGSVTLWNARIGYTSEDARWAFAVFSKNLTNEEYFGSGFTAEGIGFINIKPGARRYFGLEAKYSFGG